MADLAKPRRDDFDGDDVVIAPPSVDFVADTASAGDGGPKIAPPPGLLAKLQASIQYSEQRFEASFSPIPMPSAEQLERLVKIRESAADDIFEEYKAQGAHRRELEKSVVATKNLLAIRGQVIGGGLGAIGLVGALVVAGLGQGWAGFGIALGSLGSLVSIFVLGQGEQRKNLEKNSEVRSDMTERKPIEEVDAVRGGHSKQATKKAAKQRAPREPKASKQAPDP